MTALWIIIGILLFIFILLLCRIHLTVSYNEKLEIFAKYLFLKYKIYPKPNKEETEEKSEEEKPAEEKKESKKSAAGEFFKDFLTDYFEHPDKNIKENKSELVKEGIKLAFKKLKLFLRHLKVNKFDIYIGVARDDAAKTAIAYGYTNGAVYSAFAFLKLFININKYNLKIEPRFTEIKNSYKANIEISSSLLILIIIGLSLVFQGKKIYNKIIGKNNK